MLPFPQDSLSALYIATGPMLSIQSSGMATRRQQYLLDVILAVKRPTIIVGMGVISNVRSRSTCSSELATESKAFLRTLQATFSKFGGFVGFRGKCSEQLAHHAGFTGGFISMGCPSLFINKNRSLGHRLEEKYGSVIAMLENPARRLKIGLMCVGMAIDHAMIKFVTSRGAAGSLILKQDNRDSSCINANIKVAEGVKVKSTIFYDIETWREAVSQLDVVVGPRIHGSMLSLSMEVPSITFPFDMRIQEMCDSMRLACAPMSISRPNRLSLEGITDVITKAASQFNGTEFDRNRQALARKYAHYFKKNGMESHPSLLELANGVLENPAGAGGTGTHDVASSEGI
jgi:hypothetical protein